MLRVQTKKWGTVAVLCLQGQIVTGETDSLRAALTALSGVNSVILDFASVSTVDAGGLGVMLGLREHALARGMRFALMNVTKGVSVVLAVARLDSVFEITSEEFFPLVSHRRRMPAAVLALRVTFLSLSGQGFAQKVGDWSARSDLISTVALARWHDSSSGTLNRFNGFWFPR